MNGHRIPATGGLGRGKARQGLWAGIRTYVMGWIVRAINHQKRAFQAASIAVNVFPERANNMRFSSQFFSYDYGFLKKFQVFSLRIGKPGDSLGGIVMQRTSLTQGITRT
jgi:hypothetical protein